ASSFEESQEVCEILPIPGRKRFQELQPLAFGIDDELDGTRVRRRRHVSTLSLLESSSGELVPGRRLEPDLLPAIVDEGVAQGIEAQLSTQRQRGHDFRAADEGQRRGHAVVAPGNVAVKGCDNSVLFLALDVLTFPLPDARPAGIAPNPL